MSVLWILAILMVVALGFSHRSMQERRMAWYALDHEQAQQMARAAAERGLFELRNKLLLDTYDNQAGYTGLDQRWARPLDLYRETDYFQSYDEQAFAEDICRVRILDAQRRWSVNHASREVLESFNVFDFRTIERIIEARGASTDGYQRALFHTVEELRDLQSVSEESWSGSEGQPGLRDRLTVTGAPDGKINVNTALKSVLEQVPNIEPDVVDAITAYRNGDDGVAYTADDRAFRSVAEIAGITGISAEKLGPVNAYCTADSRFFTIRAQASRRRGKINAFCTVTVELRGGQAIVLEWREDTVGA